MSGFFDPVGGPADLAGAPTKTSGDKGYARMREEYSSSSSGSGGSGSSGSGSGGSGSSGSGSSSGGSSSGGSSSGGSSTRPLAAPVSPVTIEPMPEGPTRWPLGETWRDGGYTDAVARLGIGIGKAAAGGPPLQLGSPDKVLIVSALVVAELMATDAVVAALGVKSRFGRALGYVAVGLATAGVIGYATYRGR